MLKLSLEAIQTVDAVDRFGSFSAAAEKLYKVPSTISYTVAKLEEQLGILLFERNGPRVSLTPAGQELLREGRWLLEAAGNLENRLRRISTGYEAELRLVLDSLLPVHALIADIQAFEAIACGTTLRIATESLSGAWEALKEGRADLIIASGEGPSGGGYKTVPLGSVKFVFCVVPTHPLAKTQNPITTQQLLEHTAIVVADSARNLPARTIGLLAGQGRITVADMASKVALQCAGLGHGFLPEECVRDLLKHGTLVALPVEEPRPDESFWLAWRTNQQGEALRWWQERLGHTLFPAVLAA